MFNLSDVQKLVLKSGILIFSIMMANAICKYPNHTPWTIGLTMMYGAVYCWYVLDYSDFLRELRKKRLNKLDP